MLTALLEKEVVNADIMQAYFLQALYWSLGAGLLEDGRIKFDRYIKYLAAMSQVDPSQGLAGPGRLLSFVF